MMEQRTCQATEREHRPGYGRCSHCMCTVAPTHCANLVTQADCTASPLTSDALDWVHKLGCLYKMSGKYKTKLVNIAAAASGTVSKLQPLCQTRWTTRTPAIWSVLSVRVRATQLRGQMPQTLASQQEGCWRGLEKVPQF